MAHKFVDGDSLVPSAAVPFSCSGGVNTDSPKLEAYPGSLQDCRNFEVTETRGYTSAEGLLEFNGAYHNFPLFTIVLEEVHAYYVDEETTAPINWFAHTPGQIFRIKGGGSLQVIKVDESVEPHRVYAQVIDGDIPDVDDNLELEDGFIDSARYYILKVIEKGFPSTRFSWYEHTSRLLADITSDHGVRMLPFSGPIVGIWEIDNQIYIAGAEENSYDPVKIYKQPDLYDSVGAWTEVDMGHEVEFDNGTVSFLSSMFDEYDDKVLNSVAPEPSGYFTLNDLRSSVRTATWIGNNGVDPNTQIHATPASHIHDDDAKHVYSAFTEGSKESLLLRLGQFNLNTLDSRAVITGVQVRIRANASVDDVISIKEVCLFDGNDDVAYSRVVDQDLTTTKTLYQFGKNGDTWQDSPTGRPSFSAKSVADDKFGVGIRLASGSHFSWPQYGYVYQVEVEVHYESGDSTVYFYGAEDVSTAKVVHSSKIKGNWDTEDAEGFLSLYDVTSPENIIGSLQIRSGPDGTGDLLATTKLPAYKVQLPSWDSINSAKAKVYTIKTNFYSDATREAVYGVTGVSPAFSFNGNYFAYLRTGVPVDREKPRHVGEHSKHLLLGYESGHVMISAPGQPHNYSAAEGASERGYGAPITGFLPLNGNALAVFTDDKVMGLVGSTALSFQDNTISPYEGAMEYTVGNLSEPLFCARSGVATITTVQTYGDFSVNKLTAPVYSWIAEKFQPGNGKAVTNAVFAYVDRNKNQYRVIFDDGDILTLTMINGPEGMSIENTFQNYELFENEKIISWYSGVLDNEQEVVLFGTNQGRLWSAKSGLTGNLGKAGSLPTGLALSSYIEFNPFQSGEGFMNFKFNEGAVHGVKLVSPQLTVSAGVNYFGAEDDTMEQFVDFGEDADIPEGDKVYSHDYRKHAKAVWYLPSITDGYSIKIVPERSIIPLYTLQHLVIRPKQMSTKSANPRRV